MKTVLRCQIFPLAGALAATSFLSRLAGAWPDQPIRLIVRFTPGGRPDFIAG